MQSNMASRSILNWKVIILGITAFCMVYGLFSYNKTLKMLDNHRKRLVKLSERAEAADAQLQVSIERRNDCIKQLKSVKEKLTSLKRVNDESVISASKTQHEQTSKMRNIMLNYKSLETKFRQLQDDYDALRVKSQKQQTEFEEIKRKKDDAVKKADQEKVQEIQLLKDEIANLKRLNEDYLKKGLLKKPNITKVVDKEDKNRHQVLPPLKTRLPIDSRLAQRPREIETPVVPAAVKSTIKSGESNAFNNEESSPLKKKPDSSAPQKLEGGADKPQKLEGGAGKPQKLEGGADKPQKLEGGADKPQKLEGGAAAPQKVTLRKKNLKFRRPVTEQPQAQLLQETDQEPQNVQAQKQQLDLPVPKVAVEKKDDNQLQNPVHMDQVVRAGRGKPVAQDSSDTGGGAAAAGVRPLAAKPAESKKSAAEYDGI